MIPPELLCSGQEVSLGIRNPKPSKLAAIAHALGVNVEVLLNSDFDNITAMHRLFQLFRQYDGAFDQNGNLQFRDLSLFELKVEWTIYQKELAEARQIEDEQIRQCAVEDIEIKFRCWMDNYKAD